jgi:hypothetical protein
MIGDFLTEVDINDKKIVRITHPKVIVKDIKPETYNVEWKIDEADLIILGDSGGFAEKTY